MENKFPYVKTMEEESTFHIGANVDKTAEFRNKYGIPYKYKYVYDIPYEKWVKVYEYLHDRIITVYIKEGIINAVDFVIDYTGAFLPITCVCIVNKDETKSFEVVKEEE